jgi:His-Xaa-Ser system radical SAM maturase HxsC
MLRLAGKYSIPDHHGNLDKRTIIRVSKTLLPAVLRKEEGYLLSTGEMNVPRGYAVYVLVGENRSLIGQIDDVPVVVLPEECGYLGSGDIIRFDPANNSFRVLYRRASASNSFLLTERCNNYCLMCSQPPKPNDDSWLLDEIIRSIPLIDVETKEIGFTGGEPTLVGERLFEILSLCRSYLPRTSVHVLSNGRKFSEAGFAEKYASIGHPDMMVGIPLYSDLSSIHDYVVQADGAYDETLKGILNLKRLGQRVEIRIVLHKQTYERLPNLAEFIARNLVFVDQVVLMGMEQMGFAKTNIKDLWVDPYDYQDELFRACNILTRFRIRTSIYNQQLCVLDRRLWHLSRKSISDWKNEYLPSCVSCAQLGNCGGFFSSTLARHSEHVSPFAQ